MPGERQRDLLAPYSCRASLSSEDRKLNLPKQQQLLLLLEQNCPKQLNSHLINKFARFQEQQQQKQQWPRIGFQKRSPSIVCTFDPNFVNNFFIFYTPRAVKIVIKGYTYFMQIEQADGARQAPESIYICMQYNLVYQVNNICPFEHTDLSY